MPKETGGQAFPHFYVWDRDRREAIEVEGGMTLRDWFAGQIAAACIARADGADPRIQQTEIARDAYSVADAMIAERDK